LVGAWPAEAAAERYGVGLAASAADAETVILADARSDRLMAPTGEALAGLMVAAAGLAVVAADGLNGTKPEPALTRDGCWESTTSAATRVAPLADAEAVAAASARSVPDPIAAARMAMPDLVALGLTVPDLAIPASLMTPLPLDRAPICPALADRAPDLVVFAGTRSPTTELRATAAEDRLAACAPATCGMPITAIPIIAVPIVTALPMRQASRCVALIMTEVPLILS
jgi:hypothetical protein